MNKTIFVAIAAYNELDLLQTVQSCIDNAKYPDNLRFGIFSLNSDGQQISIPFKNVKLLTAQYSTLMGVGFSRLNAFSLYEGEDYVLQVDAHMIFEPDWDEVLVTKYEFINLSYEKPIISTYGPWWYKKDNGEIAFSGPFGEVSCAPMKYTGAIREGSPDLVTGHFNWTDNVYAEHHGIGAAFLFTKGEFVSEIMPDPLIMFSGEEPTTALRAWTRGYRMFAIQDSIAWHLNKPAGQIYEKDRLAYIGSANDEKLYYYKTEKSLSRVKNILLGNITGYWGSPTKELLTNFQMAASINFEEMYREYESNEL